MNLQPITERTAYLPGANNLGLIFDGAGGAIAVDSGIDKDAARHLAKAVEAQKLVLRAIISTHHHADHVGGNSFLLKRFTGVQVYAPPLEAALIAHPTLEPIYLNYGARPISALRDRWLMASGSPVHHLLGDPEAIAGGRSTPAVVAGVEVAVIGLPGHSPAQIGVSVDGVCFAADGFFGTAVLAKHGIPYAHDIAAQLTSLDTLAARNDAYFLPGHGTLLSKAELNDTLQANRAAIESGCDLILAALNEPGTIEAITARVLLAMSRHLGGIPQYVIFNGAIAAHLAYLEQRGLAYPHLEVNGVIWSRR